MAIVFGFQKFSASGLVGSGFFDVLTTASNEHFTIKNAVIAMFGTGAVLLNVHIFPIATEALNTNKILGEIAVSGAFNPFLNRFPLENMVIPPSHKVQYRYFKISPFTPNGSVLNAWVSGVLTTDQP